MSSNGIALHIRITRSIESKPLAWKIFPRTLRGSMFQTYFRFKLRVKLNPTSILEDSQDRSTKIVSYIQHMDLSLLSGALLGVVDVLPEESA